MSESLLKNDLNHIWYDRTLNQAYKIFGGIPDIDLENVQQDIQKNVKYVFQDSSVSIHQNVTVSYLKRILSAKLMAMVI